MKITEFKNKHKNEDIYILASGKSVDFIDKTFFDNKIVIGINQTYKYFMPKYLVRKEHKFINKILSETNNNVIHFISYGDCGNATINKIPNKYKSVNNIVIFGHPENKKNNNDFNKLTDNENNLVVSHSTITSGIHLAAYMGAKNIILVGHDCGLINNESNFTNYHNKITMVQKNQNEYRLWLKKIENQTIKLKHLLKDKYNCNVLSLNPFINLGLEGNKYTK